MAEMDDKTLVSLSQQGDENAFAELVGRYGALAYQVAYGILGNREDSEEVAQDVFVRIHRALPSFRGDCSFSTWMYRIALNLARNKYHWNRVRGSKVNFSMDAPLDSEDGDEKLHFDAPSSALTPDRKSELDEMQAHLAEELAKLPEQYREILVMRNVQDMSYEDIAAALGCQLGTVKSRLARAREELKNRLDSSL